MKTLTRRRCRACRGTLAPHNRSGFCERCRDGALCWVCHRNPRDGRSSWCRSCHAGYFLFRDIMERLAPTNGQLPHADLEPRLALYTERAARLAPLFKPELQEVS